MYITGPYGFAELFAQKSNHDQDETVELLSTIDAINGIESKIYDSVLTFSLIHNQISIPLLSFNLNPCRATVNKSSLEIFAAENGIFPFELDEFKTDIAKFTKHGNIDLDQLYLYRDDFIIALYRLVHLINYHDK